MGDTKDLEVARPAPVPKLKLASSIDEVGPGQLVLVDNQGNAVSRRRLLARAYAGSVLRVSAFGMITGTLLATHHPLAAMGLWTAFCIQTLVMSGRSRVLRAGLALVAARRYDEAFVAFEELDQRNLPLVQRAMVKRWLAVLDWILGRRESALSRYDRAIDLARAHRRLRAMYWQAVLERATLLPILGRVDEARQVLRDLAGVPDGELFTMLRQDLVLTIAHHGDDPAVLPDDLVLHDWARAALRRTRFGITVARLAWAFARRGDASMAQHLLAEAPSRLDYPVANADPALGAWMAERAAEWGIADDVET